MCVPMPPLFLLCPLRWMMLPLTGRLPVIAQILAIGLEVFKRSGIQVTRFATQGNFWLGRWRRGIGSRRPARSPALRTQHLEFLPEMPGVQQLQQAEFSLTEPGRFSLCQGGDRAGGVVDKKRLL